MTSRIHRTPQERAARSRLAQVLHAGRPLLGGSVVSMARKCGKPSCKCARGEKHVSLYLAVRHDGKRKMIYIPPPLEERVLRAVEDRAQVDQWLDEIAQAFLKELLQLKKQSK